MARYIWYIPEDDCEIGNVRTEIFSMRTDLLSPEVSRF